MRKKNNFGPDMNRRRFLTAGAAAGAALLTGSWLLPGRALAQKKLELPELPYLENALEPYISAKTISFHYGKHHAGYVKKTRAALKALSLKPRTWKELVIFAAQDPKHQSLFNNAAQVWNHTFYWQGMKPGGGGQPPEQILKVIQESFGGFSQFSEEMLKTAGSRFGSGWGWLILDKDRLKIVSTANADTPLTRGLSPILTVDVWEHAYYLDYQNRRGDYIKAWLNHLVNWDFALKNYLAGCGN